MKISFSTIAVRSITFSGILFAAVMGISSCSTDKRNEIDPIDASQTGSLELEFDNRAGSNNLILNTGVYTNSAGNQTSFTTFNYYISNIKLINENGTTVNVPGYYLVKESDATSQMISIPNVQEGNYTKVQFMVGVDSAISAGSAADRAAAYASLDPATGAAGHYWSWNSGYIFAKVEGTSPDAPLDATSNTRPFVFHVGGYKAVANATGGFNLYNNTRVVTLDFPSGTKAMVRDTRTECHIHTYVDALRFLSPSAGVSNGVNVNFTTLNFNMAVNANAQKLANNYASMFAIDHVHND